MLPSEKVEYVKLIGINAEISRLILEKKDIKKLIKYVEHITKNSLNLYAKSIKNEIPQEYLNISKNFSEELIWYYATRWDISRNSYNCSNKILWETLKQQYLLIYMMRSFLIRRDLDIERI